MLSEIVSKELFVLPFKPENSVGTVRFDDNAEDFELSSIQLSLEKGSFQLRAFSEAGAIQKRFPAKELRYCDPKTGAPLPREDDSKQTAPPPDKTEMVEVFRAGSTKNGDDKDIPDNLEKKGKVGFEVTWKDGAKYIYSRRAIALAAGGKIQ